MKRFFPMYIILLIVSMFNIAYSQVPNTLSYQALITDDKGKALDGNYSITFNIYDNAFSSTPVWSETQDITLIKGYLNVYLGMKTSFASSGLKFDKPYYLGIKIGSSEFSKTMLSSVPYCMSAATVVPKNAQNGYVLTFKDSTVQWLAPQTSSGQGISSNTVTNTTDPALKITQNGKGPVMELHKSGQSGLAQKHSDVPQGTVEDIVSELNGLVGYSLTINSEDCDGIEVYMANNESDRSGITIYNNGSGHSFVSNQNGPKAGHAGYFHTEKNSNTDNCLVGNNNGSGSAGYFVNNNFDNSSSALVGYSKGSGNAISAYIDNEKGHAGSFIIQNSSNAGAALSAYSNGSAEGTALYAKSSGIGRAASLENNTNSTEPTLYVSTKGPTDAGFFSTSSIGHGIEVTDTDIRNSLLAIAKITSIKGVTALEVSSSEADSDPTAVITKNGSSGNIALKVNGSIDCNGSISKKSGSFTIDHPLDPENKLLSHSFVESPDMKNIYDGIVVLDSNGEAIVTLPEWFEALNKDFRYQLTCIGSYATVYISEEVNNNHFKIAGGKSGMKVSWMVTGIRHDQWAVEHPIIVERDKEPILKVKTQSIQPSIKNFRDMNLTPNVDVQKIKADSENLSPNTK